MKEYGLIGEKLGHSFSREIHDMIGRYDYELIELAPAELEDFLRRREFRAVNVTIPYKKAVIPFSTASRMRRRKSARSTASETRADASWDTTRILPGSGR